MTVSVSHETADATPPRRVAYLTNQYPTVSHTFIRREILALERQGIPVDRLALRGWDAPLVDESDKSERSKTRYAQQDGMIALAGDALRTMLTRPGRFFAALGTALAMSRKAVRPLPYHLIYLAQACRIRRWLDATGASHLHAHFGTNSAEVALLVHRLGGPDFSFTIHGQDEIEGAKGLHFPTKIGDAKFAVAVSHYCRSQILREIPHQDWNKLKVVHCGLGADYFAETAAPLPDHPRFLCVARLSPEKGHLVLLDAFAALHKTHPEARLVFAGNGPMQDMLNRKIADLGLKEAVTITGWIDTARVQAELDQATALVQPSFIEGLPIVIMEAMARRRPVISTYVAGIPELVLPGETGWLVPAGDHTALARAMTEAATAHPDQLARMGDLGHDRAKDRHLVDHEAQKLARLFAGDAAC